MGKPAKWLAGVIALVLMYAAWVDAAAMALTSPSPQLVLRIKPGDAQALSAVVDQRTLAQNKITQPSKAEAARLREALRDRPLSGSILRQLAVADEIEARTPRADRLLTLSNRISRRYLLTELLLSQNAARANRPAESLRHFDAALSTHSKASSLLFPPLAGTLVDPTFRPYVAGYFHRRWAPAFLDLAIRTGKPTDVLATVVLNPLVQREERFRRFRGDLVTRLVNEGHPKLAFDYAAKAPKAESAPIGVVGFTKATTDPTLGPLLWRLSNTNGIYASLSGSAVVVDVDPASTGTAVERIFALDPGRYTILASSKVEDASGGLNGEWTALCLAGGTGRVLARTKAGFAQDERDTRLPVSLGPDCEALYVGLKITNLDDQRDAEIEISRFTIEKSGT